MPADESGFLEDHFIARDNPAWWDYEGNHTFEEEMTPTEAVGEVGLDYELEKVPNFIEYEDDGNVERVSTGKYSVVRPPVESDDQPRVFNRAVSGSYGLLQNEDMAQVVDPIAEDWPLATVGAIKNGQRVFMTLESDVHEVNGEDKVQSYFVVTDHKCGGGSLKALFTPVRVVCQNTCHLALQRAEVEIAIEHTEDVKENLELITNVMKQMRSAKKEGLEAFDEMAQTSIEEEELTFMLETAYPTPSRNEKVKAALRLERGDNLDFSDSQEAIAKQALKNWEKRRERQVELREKAGAAYRMFNDKNPDLAETVWAAYNGVTRSATHRESTNESIRGRSNLFGSRAQESRKAFKAAASLL
jgi:hypothetical protein